jgi:hypothetical protein
MWDAKERASLIERSCKEPKYSPQDMKSSSILNHIIKNE